MNFFMQIALVWMQYRAFQTTFAELSRMSDRGLKDMGLHRSDIARVALGQAEGRTTEFAARHTRPHEGAGHVSSTV
jgi:uncharacterized protein YjiS (DUF1127 family)